MVGLRLISVDPLFFLRNYRLLLLKHLTCGLVGRYSLRLAEVGGFAPWFSFVLLVGVTVLSYRWLVSLWLGLGVGGFVISSAGVERP